MQRTISSNTFYNEYHGHRVEDLEIVYTHLRSINNNRIIFLSGDSSLDNKHWFPERDEAINGYETILSPPRSKQDISYWMNYALLSYYQKNKNSIIFQEDQLNWKVLNCAIEESTVGARACGHLLPQDIFIREKIQSEDILVISLGGNDIALKPSICTICNILSLTCCTTQSCLQYSCGTSLPCDDCFCGCCCSCLSNFFAFPFGFGYFIHLFKTRIEILLNNMTRRTRPKYIFVCMIYYLDETPGNSWAEIALSALQYNQNPKKLQLIISKLFHYATKEIKIEGSKVIGIPLFQVLNGKNSKDYIQRVEPSAMGGKKMGEFIITEIMKHVDPNYQQEGEVEKGEEDIHPIEVDSMVR